LDAGVGDDEVYVAGFGGDVVYGCGELGFGCHVALEGEDVAVFLRCGLVFVMLFASLRWTIVTSNKRKAEDFRSASTTGGILGCL
jgi:hypothetical protein